MEIMREIVRTFFFHRHLRLVFSPWRINDQSLHPSLKENYETLSMNRAGLGIYVESEAHSGVRMPTPMLSMYL